MNGITQELSRRASELNFDELPDDVARWAKIAIADTVGVMLAGAHEPAVELARRTLGIAGNDGAGNDRICRVLGHRDFRTSALNAALLNGVASHVHDFDDCSIILDGHPTVPMVPAILALAEQHDHTGRDVIEAYVAGYEVEVHVARYLNGGQLRPSDALPIGERGWHPTGVLGTLGCAVACARLLRLSGTQTATALSIAASSAAGLRGNSGTMTKSLHVGHANRNGLWAALLAREGFTANPAVLEHRFGYFRAYNGPGDYGSYDGLDTFGKTFELSYPGVSIKPYPCCSYTFPAIDAAIALARRHDLAVDAIAEVEVRLHERCIGNVNRPDPKTTLDAKFSTQYVTACGLSARQVVLEDFEGDAFMRPGHRDVMARIRMGSHAEDDLFLGRVDIRMRDGATHSSSASTKFGRGPDDPMTDEEFRSKFVGCAARTVTPEAAESLFDRFDRLETADSMRRVLDAAVIPSGRGSAEASGRS
ncbi:MmgE/PrpD family protein [Pseudochelatococcus sp. B33]